MSTAAERLREGIARKRAAQQATSPPSLPPSRPSTGTNGNNGNNGHTSKPEGYPDPSVWARYESAAPSETSNTPERSEAEQLIDKVLGKLSVLDAYDKWIGKKREEPKGRTEGIKVSCPMPDHVDKNPSAWVNTLKNTWYCGACGVGGDELDIAAIGLGYDLDGYKNGLTYGKFRRDAAEALGVTLEYIPGIGYITYEPITEPESPDSGGTSDSTGMAPVHSREDAGAHTVEGGTGSRVPGSTSGMGQLATGDPQAVAVQYVQRYHEEEVSGKAIQGDLVSGGLELSPSTGVGGDSPGISDGHYADRNTPAGTGSDGGQLLAGRGESDSGSGSRVGSPAGSDNQDALSGEEAPREVRHGGTARQGTASSGLHRADQEAEAERGSDAGTDDVHDSELLSRTPGEVRDLGQVRSGPDVVAVGPDGGGSENPAEDLTRHATGLPVGPGQLHVHAPNSNALPGVSAALAKDERVLSAIAAGEPYVDWKNLLPQDSFLYQYMKAVSVDDVPEEYHFWHAMLAVGLVPGRNVFLRDNPAVFANMFVCLMGSTGSGKSKAKNHIQRVLGAAYPYQLKEPASLGVKFVPTPGSAEALVQSFDNTADSPPATRAHFPASVRGFVEFSEFKSLMELTSRKGSTLYGTLIDLFDARQTVTTNALSRTSILAYRPHASVLSTIQPEALAEILSRSDEDSGFLNRWLFCGGPKKKKQLFSKVIPDLTNSTILMEQIVKWASKERAVKATPEAENMLIHAWESYIEKDVARLGASFARIDLQLKKLALIFAINETTEIVDTVIMGRALSLYPYLRQLVEIKQLNMEKNETLAWEQLVLHTLDRIDKASTSSVISQTIPYTKRRGAEACNKTCKALVEAGVLEAIQVKSSAGKGGRPTIKFWFSPGFDRKSINKR